MKITPFFLLCALAWMSTGGRGFAKDLWLEPEPLFAATGQDVNVTLQGGENFQSEKEKPLHKEGVNRFELIFGRHEPRNLLAAMKDGEDTEVHFEAEGSNALVIMDRSLHRLTEDAAAFNAYLGAQGLTAILAQRSRLGQTNQPVRERYSRYLKALVQSREPSTAPAVLYRRRVGQRLEILLETNPARLTPGTPLGIKVLFEDRPLTGAKVFALGHGEQPSEQSSPQNPVVLTAVTDARGRAAFPVKAGAWLIRLVHLRPVGEKKAGDDSQWESFWATYLFGVRFTPEQQP